MSLFSLLSLFPAAKQRVKLLSLSLNILLMVLPIVKEGYDKPWGALIRLLLIGLGHLCQKK